MKKQHVSLLIAITFIFFAFTLGFFLGRNHNHTDIQISVPASLQRVPDPTAPVSKEKTAPTEAVVFPININSAGEPEFMALPGIGQVLAQRIISYREEYGSFQTVEDLMNVEGIGEKRMEDILDLITTGG